MKTGTVVLYCKDTDIGNEIAMFSLIGREVNMFNIQFTKEIIEEWDEYGEGSFRNFLNNRFASKWACYCKGN